MRDVPETIDKEFYAQRRSERVPLVLNDTVDVVGGSHAGRSGWVISIESIQPSMTFLIELADGSGDVILALEELRLVPE